MSSFWKNWLVAACWIVGVFGLVLAGAGLEATQGGTRFVLTLLNGPPLSEFTPNLRFAYAVMGAVTIGWSITLYAAFSAAHRLGPEGRPVWKLILIAMAVWYVIDGILSVATGFPLNVLSNTILTAAFLIPIFNSGVLKRS